MHMGLRATPFRVLAVLCALPFSSCNDSPAAEPSSSDRMSRPARECSRLTLRVRVVSLLAAA